MNILWKSIFIATAGLPTLAWPDDRADRELVLGIGVTSIPEYEGGKDTRTGALPIIQWSHGRFNFDGGVYYDFLQTDAVTLSAGIGYDDGRRDTRTRRFGSLGSAHLTGMGRIDSAATADLRATSTLGGLEFSTTVTRWLAKDRFMKIEFGGQYTVGLSDRLGFVVGAYGTWVNADYAQSFFGVSGSQSTASGFKHYNAGAGIKSVRTELSAAYALTPRWSLVAMVSDSILEGDARHSPVVQTRSAVTSTLGFTYRVY